MPVTDIHLHSNEQGYNWINHNPSSPQTINVLLAIAAGILLIASINFVNLTTARALKRAREVGMRKTLGASRRELIRNYLSESLLMTMIAALLAMLLVELTAPYLAPILGKSLGGLFFATPVIWGTFFIVALIVGLVSGIYPAIVQTSFKPVDVLRGDFTGSVRGVALRQVLVIVQFTLSIALIASVLIMRGQIDYVLNMDMGYSRDQVIFFDTAGIGTENMRQQFLDRLNGDPDIVAAGSANNTPGPDLPYVGVAPQNDPEWEHGFGAQIYEIRGDWFDALKIPVVQGRSFRTDTDIDLESGVIINRAAMKMLKLDDPLGQSINLSHRGLRTVIGLAEDFNFGSARQTIAPAIFTPDKQYSTRIYIRLPAGRIQDGVDAARKVFTEVYGQELFGFRFLDDHFNHQYRADREFASNAGLFSIFALVIAALGVFGIITFIADRKRREISVRKVLGASEGSILWLLSRSTVLWVVIANVIAWPAAWLLMKTWLQQFESRVDITLIPFLIAGIATLAVALMTVSVQTIRASRINPAENLRAE
jgi:putative ABC transport system permease protein